MNILTLAIPSKGRLMEQAAKVLETAGLSIERAGTERGYRGQLKGIDGIEVAFLSAAEIAQNLREGKIDFGITGADLLWEKSAPRKILSRSWPRSISALPMLSWPCRNAGSMWPPWPISMKCRKVFTCVMAGGSGWPRNI